MERSIHINELNELDMITADPWPHNATLYQPYEAEQILLAESASCLAVKTYLRMCNLPVHVCFCANAEFMSPGGRMTRVPFLRAGEFVVSEFENIVNFVEQGGLAVSAWMDDGEKCDMRTYECLVENIFTMAELYICFANDRVYKDVTAPRIGCVFPWPLDKLQNFMKRNHALTMLKIYQFDNMAMEDVIEKVKKCCNTLENKLNENCYPFFYSEKPCELDAVTFGHLYSILTTKLPDMRLAQSIKKFERLVEFCQYVDKIYFKNYEKDKGNLESGDSRSIIF